MRLVYKVDDNENIGIDLSILSDMFFEIFKIRKESVLIFEIQK